jgi:hypothetical protein
MGNRGGFGPKAEENYAMTMNLGRESAKIYQFPTKVPLSADARRTKVKSTVDLKNTPPIEITYGSGWYHDAAIREADRDHKI